MGDSEDEYSGQTSSSSNIKRAVAGTSEDNQNQDSQRTILDRRDTPSTPMTAEYEGMQGSMMNSSSREQQQETEQKPQYEVEYAPIRPGQEQQQQVQQQYDQGAYEGYNTYQSVSISPDTMSEVAEQVIAEKLAPLVRNLEKMHDAKATMDAQLKYMEERVKRLEKIIDNLQLSIIQKVGDYVNKVSDMKTELTETQKTFKALLNQKNK